MRLFLIVAAIFFLVFAIVVGNVFVDSVIFNCVFIIINGTYSAFLLMYRYMKIQLNPLEERIYEKDFKKVMDRRAFRNFIRSAHLRSFSEGGQICHYGNNFSGLFYVALINPNYSINYIKQGKLYMKVSENSWIGTVEFSLYEKSKKLESAKNVKVQTPEEKKETLKERNKRKVKWGLDAIVKEKEQEVIVTEQIFDEYDDPCYVYEFPLKVFIINNYLKRI